MGTSLADALYRRAPAVRAATQKGEHQTPAPTRPPTDYSRSRWFPSRRTDPHSPLPSFEGRTILVVDDDPDALELLRMILASCGAKVLAASTTQHARGYLHTITPDLIVCDLAMPREDGLAFMRAVRASTNPMVARVPAIAVTAFYEDYPSAQAREFSAYFQKPLDIDVLTRAIASLI